METIPRRSFTKNAGNVCRQMINCKKAWNYLQKTLDLLLNTKTIRKAHGLMIEDGKDALVGGI